VHRSGNRRCAHVLHRGSVLRLPGHYKGVHNHPAPSPHHFPSIFPSLVREEGAAVTTGAPSAPTASAVVLEPPLPCCFRSVSSPSSPLPPHAFTFSNRGL
jgi:hypothetical protein